MKKVFAIFAIAVAFALMSCDNPNMDDNTNTDIENYDITSGVYPYEVTDLKYRLEIWGGTLNHVFDWKNPDKNFHHVRVTASVTWDEGYTPSFNFDNEIKRDLPSADTSASGVAATACDFANPEADNVVYKYVVFQCIDMYDNVSEGLIYHISTNNP